MLDEKKLKLVPQARRLSGSGMWNMATVVNLTFCQGGNKIDFHSSHKSNAFKIPQVTLSPLFVMRSHLPEPILMNVFTAKTNSSSVLHLQGRAHEQQLYGLEPNSWHHLTFQFGGSADWSSPSVPLNSTLIELANMVTYDSSPEEEGVMWDSWPYSKNTQYYRCGEGTFLPFSLVFRETSFYIFPSMKLVGIE